jgi:hypothetical protein
MMSGIAQQRRQPLPDGAGRSGEKNAVAHGKVQGESMIRKSGCRFSEKIMRNQKDEESDFNSRIGMVAPAGGSAKSRRMAKPELYFLQFVICTNYDA